MDRKNRNYYFAYLLLQLFLPVCVSLGYFTGRPFSLTVRWLELIVLSAATVILTKQLRKGKSSYALIPLLPLSMLNALFLLLQGPLGGVVAIICLCCGWMLLQKAPKGFWRGTCYALSVLLTVGFLLMLPVWFFVQAMRSEETVWKLDSPKKHYTAIVTSVDQGALGGDTIVEVRDNRRSIPILLGRFTASREIYRGGWDTWQDMTLVWESETVLSLNGTSFPVEADNVEVLTYTADALDVSIQGGQVLEYRDTHGGFHGDGTTFVKIQGICSLPGSRFWHPLPASPNAAEAIRQSGVLPAVEVGWYYVNDRHSQCPDRADGTCLLSHGARNYTLAVYDPANGILYYYELDT